MFFFDGTIVLSAVFRFIGVHKKRNALYLDNFQIKRKPVFFLFILLSEDGEVNITLRMCLQVDEQ